MGTDYNIMKYFKGATHESSIVINLQLQINVDFKILPSYKVYSHTLGKPTEIDVLLLTEFGIFCIEAKNFSQFNADMNQRMWLGVNQFGKAYKIYNGYIQNQEHIMSLHRCLYDTEYYDIPVHNIICLPDGCKIDSNYSGVCTVSNLVNRINFSKVGKQKIDYIGIFNYLNKCEVE